MIDISKYSLERALSPLRHIGLAKPALDLYYWYSGLAKELNKMEIKNRKHKITNEKKGEVIIPYTHTQGKTDHLLGILGHAFEARGYKPLFLSCRGSLPLCLRKRKHPDDPSSCVACKYWSDKILSKYGAEKVKIKESIYDIKESESLYSYEHKGLNVGRFATASARRHMRKYRINLNNERESSILERYVKSGIDLVNATRRLMRERDIKAVVGNHPAYVYGGVVLEAARKNGIPAISYGGGYFRKDAILFGNMKNRKGFEMFSDKKTLNKKVKTKLTKKQKKEVEYYMRGRKTGDTVRSVNRYVQDSFMGFKASDNLTNVAMFTNLLWDGSLSESSVTFNSPLEWIKETINYVNKKDNISLIVKPHPAEYHRGTNINVKKWIEKELKTSSKITILEANTDVSPYELLDDIDVALVFNSTIGLEAAYDGVPVITTGDTHYKYLGFTYDPVDPKKYFSLLNEINNISISKKEVKKAKRYAHFLLAERHISFSSLNSISSITEASVIQIIKDEKFDAIIKQILGNSRSISIPQ